MGERATWLTDRITPHERHGHRLTKTIQRIKTPFQTAELADTRSFGRCLILDGEIQSARLDEFIYHEALVHPALTLHPRPRDILVLGGGEGATLREILRHPCVRRATMVDLDGDVVELCRRYLPAWSAGAFAHRKSRVIISDARKFILETDEQFDIIISDLPTPSAGSSGPVAALYTIEFYRRVIARLNTGGIFVTQAGSGSLLQLQFHAALHKTLAKLFKVVRPYYAHVPSFDVPWAVLVAARKADPRGLTAAAVDRRLRPFAKTLRFYDGETHEGLFRVPKYLRGLLERERRVITEKK